MRAFRAHRDGKIERSFENWCKATARHVAVDIHRRDTRVDLTDDLSIGAAPEHTETTVEHRLALEGLFAVWPELSAEEKARLLAVEAPLDALARNRYYVALHRLRHRVRHLAEAATLGWVSLLVRRRRTGVALSGVFVASAIGVALLPAIGTPDPVGGRSTTPRAVHVDPTTERLRATIRTELTSRVEPTGANHPRVDVALPAGRRAYVYTRPVATGEALLCVRTSTTGAPACIPHPLRDLHLEPGQPPPKNLL